MVSIVSGATPAAARLAFMKPALSVICPAVPVSIRTSFLPVLTISAVKVIGSTFGGRNAAASASLTGRAAGVANEMLVDRQKPDAVIERGELVVAELVAISAGPLRLAAAAPWRVAGVRDRCAGRGQQRPAQERTAGKRRSLSAMVCIKRGIFSAALQTPRPVDFIRRALSIGRGVMIREKAATARSAGDIRCDGWQSLAALLLGGCATEVGPSRRN